MGLGVTEWVVILLIVVLLFGARKLPELAKSMGSSVNAFKQGMRDGNTEAAEKEKPKDDGHSANGHTH